MNLFSKWPVLPLLFLISSQSWGLNLTAIYTSACKRQLGIIINVDEDRIHYLNLDGEIIHMRPHEVIFLAHYPIDQLPIHQSINFSKVDALKIKTQEGTEIKDLVQGWPIGFSKDKVSFLTPEGRETLISRKNIFSLEYFNVEKIKFKQKHQEVNYNFVHPHVFRECPLEGSSKKVNYVYPQQVLSDPIMIKREIDHLRFGYMQVRRYHREQDFYPVPEVYPNATSLGIWQTFGSRHGSATHRTNNLTPVLTDSYSSDIFDYQHVFVTGSAPLPFALHEEPQTQIYYKFKSSYFHFSSMVDPSLVLVGQNYEWQQSDFKNYDDKIVSTILIELGLDIGNFSFDIYAANNSHVGINFNNVQFVEDISIPMIGISYRNHNYSFQLLSGAGTYTTDNRPLPNNTMELSATRFNLYLHYWKLFDLQYSLIFRGLDATHIDFLYESQTFTNAIYANYKWLSRYNLGGFVSVESQSQKYGASQLTSEDSSNYFKAGAFVSLSF